MKQLFFPFFAFIALVTLFSSCEKNPVENQKPQVTTGVFILNNGSFGQNNSAISIYNPKTKSVAANVFEKLNGKKLGDTAQDMLIYGTKIFVSVYNSKIIFVTDTTGKVITEITVPGDKGNLSPRFLTSYKGKVYVSLYEGYLGEIDTTKYSVRKVAVGANPEGVKEANGKLYVANSGGMSWPTYGNTVSVVDPTTLTVTKTLEVASNPCHLVVDSQKDLYLLSLGDYTTKTFQKINSTTDAVTKIPEVSASFISMGAGDTLYFVNVEYENFKVKSIDYKMFDTRTDKVLGNFITDGTVISAPCCISADPVSRNIYIGTSDYVNNGDMYVFSSKGVKLDKFDTGGINPMGAYFLRNR